MISLEHSLARQMRQFMAPLQSSSVSSSQRLRAWAAQVKRQWLAAASLRWDLLFRYIREDFVAWFYTPYDYGTGFFAREAVLVLYAVYYFEVRNGRVWPDCSRSAEDAKWKLLLSYYRGMYEYTAYTPSRYQGMILLLADHHRDHKDTFFTEAETYRIATPKVGIPINAVRPELATTVVLYDTQERRLGDAHCCCVVSICMLFCCPCTTVACIDHNVCQLPCSCIDSSSTCCGWVADADFDWGHIRTIRACAQVYLRCVMESREEQAVKRQMATFARFCADNRGIFHRRLLFLEYAPTRLRLSPRRADALRRVLHRYTADKWPADIINLICRFYDEMWWQAHQYQTLPLRL